MVQQRPQPPWNFNKASPHWNGLIDVYPGEPTSRLPLTGMLIDYGSSPTYISGRYRGFDEPRVFTEVGALNNPGALQRVVNASTGKRLFPQTGAFTTSQWLWTPLDATTSFSQEICLIGNTWSWNLRYLANGTAHYVTSQLVELGSNPTLSSASTVTWAPGTWAHVAATWHPPSKYFALYCNGKLAAYATATNGSLRDTDTWWFGGNSGGFGHYGALIDARLYNRAMTAAEVHSLWHPDTRWDLYLPRRAKIFTFGAGGGGPQTITVTEVCLGTASAVAPTITPAPLTITVSEVCLATASAVAPTPTVAPVSVAVTDAAAATATAAAPTVTLSPVTITVSEICLATATAVEPDVLAGGVISVSQVCLGTASAIAPTITPSPVTITVTEVCLATATAVAPDVSQVTQPQTITVSEVCLASSSAIVPTPIVSAVTITVSQICLATASAVVPDVSTAITIPGMEYSVVCGQPNRLHYSTTEE